MIKYIAYWKNCVMREENKDGHIAKYLLKESDYSDIILAFLKKEYTVTLDGDTLLLEGEDITFELKHVPLDILENEYEGFLDELLDDVRSISDERGFYYTTNLTVKEKLEDFFGALRKHLGKVIVTGIATSLLINFAVGEALNIAPTLVNKKNKDDKKLEIETSVGMPETAACISESESIIYDSIEDTKEEIAANDDPVVESEPVTYEDMMDSYIAEYATYFHLDPEKTVIFAHLATDYYQKDFTQVIGSSYYNVDSPEAACMLFVYNVYRDRLANSLETYAIHPENSFYDFEKSPEENMYSQDFFRLDMPIEHISPDLVLSSGLTYTQYLGKTADLFGTDKTYLFAISYLESDRVRSPLARNKNNFGGMRYGGVWLSFPTPEAGIIAFCYNLRTYASYGFTSLEAMSGTYVNGDGTPSLSWVENVRSIHYEAIKYYDTYFLPEGEMTKTEGEEFIRSLAPKN